MSQHQGDSADFDLRICPDWDSLPLTSDEWNGILRFSATNTVFQTYEWHETWWKVFGQGKKLMVMIAYELGQPVAVAPLYLHDDERGQSLRFIGSGHADYLDVICPARLNDRLLTAVLLHLDSENPAPRMLELHNLPGESPSNETLRSSHSGYRGLRYAEVPCPTLQISGNEDAVQRIVGRYSLRRPENYFRRAGKLEYLDLSDAGDINDHLERFFDQHVQRWQIKGGESRFLEPCNRKFFEELAPRLQARGWLQFSATTLNDQPLAYHFGFTYDNRLLWYKPSFDSTHEKGSPGLLMLRYLIDSALSSGLEELDFTVGDEAFKMRFSSSCRTNCYWRVYRSKVRYTFARTQHIARICTRRLLSKVQATAQRVTSRPLSAIASESQV